MKIPFDIKFRPQIESGEYKVETRDGRSVRIICWDRVAKENLNLCVLVPEDDGEAVYYYHQSGKKWVTDEMYDLFLITPEPELSEFEHAFGLAIVDAPEPEEKEEWYPYIKEKAAELLELAKNEILRSDKWIIGNDALRLTYERGKAEALKDLPRWKKCGKYTVRTYGVEHFEYRSDGNYLVANGMEILFSDLEKLPGFNE